MYHSPDFIAGVTYDGKAPTKIGRSLAYSFSFDPSQPLEAEVGGEFIFSFGKNKNVKILEIDLNIGTISAKTTETDVPGAFDLIPAKEKIMGLADEVLDQARRYCSGEVHPALDDFLNRRHPRLSNGVTLPQTEEATTTENISAVISAMSETALVIQGPPGAGKTFVGAHAIAALCRLGKRIGIMSNSHKAIDNLLLEAAKIIRSKDQAKRIVRIGGDLVAAAGIEKAASGGKVEDVDSIALVGGTAWAFANANFEGKLDYLFIDEASQVSLASLVAVVKSTKNIVFLGDQMQLSQPSRASHPGDSGLSCLEYFLQENATIPLNLGIFLPITRRMHPSLCHLVSDAVYEGRLKAHPSTEDRFLIPNQGARSITKPNGILYIPVEHEGNRQSSAEEAETVKSLVEELLLMNFQSSRSELRRLSAYDIIIVAPYNQHVRLLKRTLGDGFRIASIDKFQGQEAPVVILSLGSSSAHDAPRGVEFILDKNRLNVALSRAQVMPIVVGCPDLSSTFAQNPAQMSLVNFYCRIVQEGVEPYQKQIKAS